VPGGGWNHLTFTPSNGDSTQTWLAQGDRSWVCHSTTPDGIHTVRQGGPPDSGTRSKPHTSNGARSTDPPATSSVSPSTTAKTPSGSTIQTAHTSGYFRHRRNPADGNFFPFSADVVTWGNGRLPGKNFPPIRRLLCCLAAGGGYRFRRLMHAHIKGGGG
jgi:hypothetical protein